MRAIQHTQVAIASWILSAMKPTKTGSALSQTQYTPAESSSYARLVSGDERKTFLMRGLVRA